MHATRPPRVGGGNIDCKDLTVGSTLGYERHTTGNIRTLRVESSHSTMHREHALPIGAALADMLRSGSAAH